MISFEKLEGPYGIPVYYQHLPDPVRSVSIGWTMLVGAADDESAGAPGLYHWFEHVPFRGTKRFPGGTKDIRGFCNKYGGHIGAYTGPLSTTYHATVPTSIWKEALSRITDLISQPLLEPASVEAEKKIIFQEIAKRKSTSQGTVYYRITGIVWPGHALGHHVLGSEDTLASMTPSVMKEAHATQYDRSRCVLFVAGNIAKEELLAELAVEARYLPDHGLPPRQAPVHHGDLPLWQKGVTSVVNTTFESSTVLMLFALPATSSRQDLLLKFSILGDIFSFGGVSAPLMRIVREERNLVYGTHIFENYVPGGGYWGFSAETQPHNVEKVIAAFKDVLRDPEAYSENRLETVKAGIAGAFDIRPIDPMLYRERGLDRLIDSSTVYSDQDYLDALNKTTPADIKKLIDTLDPSNAHTIIFRGAGK